MIKNGNSCLCNVESCSNLTEEFGICDSHFAKLRSVNRKEYKKLLIKWNIFYSFRVDSYLSRGRKYTSYCITCGELHIRSDYGRDTCLSCVEKETISKIQKITKEQNAQLTKYFHLGIPKIVKWTCKKCKKEFKVVLLQNKIWYYITCEECRK